MAGTTKRPPKKSATKKKYAKTKLCISCPDGKSKATSAFYRSTNPMHADGLLPICKTCIKKACYDPVLDEINVDAFKNILRQCDRPFIPTVYNGSVVEYETMRELQPQKDIDKSIILSSYFRKLNSLHQYKGKTWNDSYIDQKDKNTNSPDTIQTKRNKDEHIYLKDTLGDFIVTTEMIKLFGEGLKRSEYKLMWDKYQFLKQSYPDITNLHTEALATYVRFKTKEEMATIEGNISEADKWNQMATKAADRAKINPSQLSKTDLQGGINSFAEVCQAVEQAVDVIPILPQFKFRPNDAIDFNIWCIINYLRDLEGKPLCSYEDVYKFYDRRKAEYIEQYGDPYHLFDGDTTESNRKNIEKFITLPSDFQEDAEVTET